MTVSVIMVPRVGLQCVIVALPDYTHLVLITMQKLF